jgi:hypothetical protein
LDFYEEYDGSRKYGIVPREVPAAISTPNKDESKHFDKIIHPTIHRGLESRCPHRKGAIGLIFFLLGLLVVIIYYKLEYDPNSQFEQFMDSQGFGVRFLFTAIGVLIKLYWSSIFKGASTLFKYRPKS